MTKMTINEEDIEFKYARGKGCGGQHKNKTSSRVTAIHKPTGVRVVIDGRDQHANKKKALKELEKRLKVIRAKEVAGKKKKKRDLAIKDETIIRTYHYGRGTVKDHRTGKVASIKDVVEKGNIDLLK